MQRVRSSHDPLDILGLNERSALDDARQQYRRLAMVFHPDKGGDAELFLKVKDAYEKVKQPKYFKRRMAMRAISGNGPDAPSKKEKKKAPVLYKPPIRYGHLIMEADKIMNKYLITSIKEWGF
jgi:curved DNA-binding protein CbpA